MRTTTLSFSRLMFLLTLAVVMIFSASQVDSSVPIGLPCCHNVTSRRVRNISKCYEQKPRQDCSRHAFLITREKLQPLCISPDAQWLQDKITKVRVGR
uniref:Chemokine interleukin-8-like domain-containing protein n=1 Tax=Scophthalmus maximus TaxID=52904 RepID=A0A8D3DGI5_SCOMX